MTQGWLLARPSAAVVAHRSWQPFQKRFEDWTMQRESISRAVLYRQLVRAAQVRSGVTMLSSIVGLFLLATITSLVPLNVGPVVPVIVFFGLPLLVCWLATVQICRRMVTCPNCTMSLWSCGSGNFKPRRLQVKADVAGCPHCGIPIL